MKLLLLAQKYFRMLGIYPPPDTQSSPFNLKNGFFLAIMALSFIFVAIFGLTKAASVSEYGLSFYAFSTAFLLFNYFVIKVWKIVSISQLIKNLEDFINKSKVPILVEKIKFDCAIDLFGFFRITCYFRNYPSQNQWNSWEDLQGHLHFVGADISSGNNVSSVFNNSC